MQCDEIVTRNKIQTILRDAALVDNVWVFWYYKKNYTV